MKIRLSQLLFVLSQPKLSIHFNNFIFTVFKEVIVIFLICIAFGEILLPTYLPTYLPQLYIIFSNIFENTGRTEIGL